MINTAVLVTLYRAITLVIDTIEEIKAPASFSVMNTADFPEGIVFGVQARHFHQTGGVLNACHGVGLGADVNSSYAPGVLSRESRFPVAVSYMNTISAGAS